MVKHNFARGAVDIFDAGMWELYCTSPRLTISLAFSQTAYSKQPQRIVCMNCKNGSTGIILCTVAATSTSLKALCVVGKG